MSTRYNDNFDNGIGSNAAINVILGTVKSSLEKNLNDSNLLATLGMMHVRFKESFENLLKTNRIQDYDETQNYNRIKRTHSIHNRFVDTKFRTVNSSIYYTEKFRNYLKNQNKIGHTYDGVIWKRAKDLHKTARFAVDDQNSLNVYSDSNIINERNYKKYFQTTDLDQGSLGNCWFISGATGIIQNYNLLKRVVPFDNSFKDDEYTGAFHFRFWIYGTWKDVVIDDYLPVDPYDRLIFCKNRETPNEFWCALLEKAYAKLCGCYEALEGGFTSDALIDMSGGIEETYSLINMRNSLSFGRSSATKLDYESFWNILIAARKKSSVIGCNIELKDKFRSEVRQSNGLVQGHAYILTRCAEVSIYDTNYRLIRLYNPWGNEVEWNGKWSDRSSSWYLIDDDTKAKLELKIEKDGEFWMSYEDWINNFDHCQICNLTPDVITDISENDWNNSHFLSNIFSMWQPQLFHGKWSRGISAGGCGQFNRDKYWTNPQYEFSISETDLTSDNSCWVIISLMQKHTRQKRIMLGVESAEEYIQFRLYKIRDSGEKHYNSQLSRSNDLERIDSSGAYTNKREVSARFTLKTGVYVIIPSCYDEDVEGEFLLRIFTEKPLNKKECRCLTSDLIPHSYSQCREHNEIDVVKSKIKNLSDGANQVLETFVGIANGIAKASNANERNKKNQLKPQISCSQM